MWNIGKISVTVTINDLNQDDLSLIRMAQQYAGYDDLGAVIRMALQALIDKKITESLTVRSSQ
jgi:hypothetical protein